ncbi:MAG TPA: hypothetical protein VHK90_00380 [Thermoanaerobaculia bacterium]|nr:hypothetical protein [Thermoanaerobaculia bacterium]
MSLFVEALMLLLPADAGGRTMPVAPRDGSYRPYVAAADFVTRARVFEGPPRLAPGDEARVMLEIESDSLDTDELQVLEHDHRLVGIVTVLRICRSSTAV